MSGGFYVTTPIYYMNGSPHIGHTYTTCVADTLTRYHRLRGEEVFFLTGSDEHGEKILETAEREGRTPQEVTDHYAAEFRETWTRLGLDGSLADQRLPAAADWGGIPVGSATTKGKPLFPRIATEAP